MVARPCWWPRTRLHHSSRERTLIVGKQSPTTATTMAGKVGQVAGITAVAKAGQVARMGPVVVALVVVILGAGS